MNIIVSDYITYNQLFLRFRITYELNLRMQIIHYCNKKLEKERNIVIKQNMYFLIHVICIFKKVGDVRFNTLMNDRY
jgi:hypothetical protein